MTKKDRLLRKIIEKAWSDPEFKKALVSDPKKAIKDAFSIDIDDDITITVCEETEKHFYLVIPPKPSLPGYGTDGAMW